MAPLPPRRQYHVVNDAAALVGWFGAASAASLQRSDDAFAALPVARIGHARPHAPAEQLFFTGAAAARRGALESVAQLLDLHRKPLLAQIGRCIQAKQQLEFNQRFTTRLRLVLDPRNVILARIFLVRHG